MTDETPIPAMTNAVKANSNYITKVVVACLAGLITLGLGTCGYTKYQDYRIEQDVRKRASEHKEAQAAYTVLEREFGK